MPSTTYVDPQTLHNPTVGGTPPSSWGDAVRDDLEHLIDPPRAVAVTNPISYNQPSTSPDNTLPDDGTPRALNWVTIVEDTDGFFEELPPPSGYTDGGNRIVIPDGLDGGYQLSVLSRWTGGDGATWPATVGEVPDWLIPVDLTLYVNGVQITTMGAAMVWGGGKDTTTNGSSYFRLSAGDIVSIYARRWNPVGTIQVRCVEVRVELVKVAR